MSISYVHRPTGRTFASLPTRLVHDGVVVHFAAIEAAGNLNLPYAGLYPTSVSIPLINENYQKLIPGPWEFDDESGIAHMEYSVEYKTTEEATAGIKQECSRRIIEVKGTTMEDENLKDRQALARVSEILLKKINSEDDVNDANELDALTSLFNETKRLRSKSNELESQYAVEPFDYLDDSVWD